MISIGISPDIFEIGSFHPTWHSLFTVVSVALAVYLIDRWGKREGLQEDAVTSTAVWAIIGGIVGARLVFVIYNWGRFFPDDLGGAFAIWEGGIAVSCTPLDTAGCQRRRAISLYGTRVLSSKDPHF